MREYKIIILGPQCSGKTTLKKYLENNFDLPLVEEDELFTELNGGKYPEDIEYKEKVLRPKLEERIRQESSMIFLSSYCNLDLLNELRKGGYQIIQLVISPKEFERRNTKRMEEQGYADANIWAKEVFGFHQEIRDKELVDLRVDVEKPIEDVAKEVIDFINN